MHIVLQSIVGQPICLELKNDDQIHGTIESVDQDMNVSLEGVTYIFAKVRSDSSECNVRSTQLSPAVCGLRFFVRGCRLKSARSRRML